MTVLSRLRRLGKEQGGAVLVEFTLVAPLLIGLMCGLAEFGQILRQYHIMQKGVRDAARYLSHVSAQPPCTGISDPNWGTEVANAQNLAVYGTTTAGTPLYRGWTDPTTVSVPAPACLANPRVNGAALPQITVTATAPYNDLGMLAFLGLGAITLTVSHQELKVT
jgi:Flp pilus assembly protein TadG